MTDFAPTRDSIVSPIRSSVYAFSPAVATHILETCKYSGQRPLRQGKVDKYALEMKAGTFTSNTIIQAELGGHRYLVNGQHTLWAIIESGVTLQLTGEIRVVQSEDELALLYTTLDIGGKRDPATGFKPYHLDEVLDMAAPELRSLYAAVQIIKSNYTIGNSYSSIHSEKDSMLEWGPAMQSYLDCVRGAPLGKKMLRRDVVSVALATLAGGTHEFRQTKAIPFWNGTAEDDGLRNGDPRKALGRWIVDSAPRSRTRINGVSGAYALRAVAYCWNAFYAGRSVNSIHVGSVQLRQPVVIMGTAYS